MANPNPSILFVWIDDENAEWHASWGRPVGELPLQIEVEQGQDAPLLWDAPFEIEITGVRP